MLPVVLSANGPSGYSIANSLRFRASASAYLSRTPASASNKTTWTWSGWVKRGASGSRVTLFSAGVGSGGRYAELDFENNDTIFWNAGDYTTGGSTTTNSQLGTSAVYRDFSAWYHIVFVYDTTQATSSNRIKLYVNGVQATSLAIATYPSQNSSTFVNAANAHGIANFWGNAGTQQFDGYLTEINFIDGQALTPSSFGEIDSTTGVWTAKRYTGTYGTNGFRLNFSNGTSTTTLGYDSSGNGNNWTTNNISLTSGSTYDWMIDSPTSYASGTNNVGNYAVLNPLQTGSYVTGSNANLTITGNTATDSALSLSSIGNLTAGKWYWEYTQGTVGSETCGAMLQAMNGISLLNGESTTNSYGIGVRANGAVYGASRTTATITSWTTGDVIGIAVDIDNGAIYWSKNGTWLNSSVPTSGASKTGADGAWTPSSSVVVTPSFGAYSPGSVSATFGQRPFAYTPPTGFKSLNTYNLSEPTIVKGNQYFDATLYTGNGSTQSITNSGFQPDLVWTKARSNAQGHTLFDSVRGASKYLQSNSTNAEGTFTAVPSFNTDGFTSTTDVSTSGYTYVGWQWKAGGTAVTNTAGSITSQVSANAAAGFSVVTYTGTSGTVGHGLGVAPDMFIVKNRTGTADDWFVYHSALGNTKYLTLDTTGAAVTNANWWGTINSSIFTLGSVWTISKSFVAYCFAAIPGYSAFGSYTGNGSADGAFIYTGFLPKLILVKCSSTTGNWFMLDTARNTYNVISEQLEPNLSNAGSTVTTLDVLSNGFKMRTSSDPNASQTYVYAAFAANPFTNSLAF